VSPSVEDVLGPSALALAVYERVRDIVSVGADVEVRASKSQVAFRRRRGFAWLWVPGRYLRRPAADVVLSFALGRHDPSRRFKEVVHPAPAHWIHHLEIRGVDELDDEVEGWLREAADRAGRR